MLKRIQRITSTLTNIFASNQGESKNRLVQIPAGRVRIEGVAGSYVPANTSVQQEVDSFLIGRYPVTNKEFARFIDAGGYNNQAFWTEEGWDYRQRENWNQPKFYDDPQLNQAEHPVVGVNWYEAAAYCKWLNTDPAQLDKIPDGWGFILPSEQEWQRAAQGDDERSYPWGNQFAPDLANTRESAIGYPVAVTAFDRSVSPFGVRDMAGNVLEWTCTDWKTGSNDLEKYESNRVLRGGSYLNSKAIATVTARTYSNAYFRKENFGFRVSAIPFQSGS